MFKLDEFRAKEFQPRIEEVFLADLAEWFDDNNPIWRVRGLNAHELDYAEFSKKLFMSVNKNEKLFPEVIKECAYLIQGSVDPLIDVDIANKIADAYPIEFKQLVLKILELTGKGKV